MRSFWRKIVAERFGLLSFRDGPQDQTRNLEILWSASALHGSMLRIAPE